MSASNLLGRTFLVTGANSGIGRAISDVLASHSATVILAGRSIERTQPVVDAIRKAHPEATVDFLQLDLANWASIRRATRECLRRYPTVDVLVNNAGVAITKGLSSDGYHLTYATNHLGPFLFTQLLLPALRAAPQGRIVNISSVAHRTVKHLDWTLLTLAPSRLKGTFQDYAATKLMNILHAKELARHLAGTPATTYAVHPGHVASNIWRAVPGPLQWLIKFFLISNEDAARTPLYCATAPELTIVSGRYYDKQREAAPSALADDPDLASELWQRSLQATGAPNEP